MTNIFDQRQANRKNNWQIVIRGIKQAFKSSKYVENDILLTYIAVPTYADES